MLIVQEKCWKDLLPSLLSVSWKLNLELRSGLLLAGIPGLPVPTAPRFLAIYEDVGCCPPPGCPVCFIAAYEGG